MDKVVFIFGPTGAGKTEIACEVAEGIGEIVSVDSMQVYQGLELGTAKPKAEQLGRVRHHLVSIVPPDYRFSAGDFARRAYRAVSEIWSRGRVPILVGGTGLYFRALEQGLIEAPRADWELREALYREEELEKGSLYERLSYLDPHTARSLHPNDLIRIVRALEVYHLTGKTLSASIDESRGKVLRPLKIGIVLEREELYRRIEHRCREMIEKGLAWEVHDLFSRGCTERFPSMKGLGYSHFIQYFKGCCSLRETVRSFVRDTKRYAKRQLTWFRKERDVEWFAPSELGRIRLRVESFLRL